MKTVKLINGKIAIPLNIKIYMTEGRMIDIVTDLVFHKNLDLSENKSSIIEKVRDHLRYQGTTVYSDWYEDTDDTEPINIIRSEEVTPFIRNMFPELNQ